MGTILFAQVENVQVLKLSGDVRVTLGPTISRYLESIGQDTKLKSIIIDLTEAIGIDSTPGSDEILPPTGIRVATSARMRARRIAVQ